MVSKNTNVVCKEKDIKDSNFDACKNKALKLFSYESHIGNNKSFDKDNCLICFNVPCAKDMVKNLKATIIVCAQKLQIANTYNSACIMKAFQNIFTNICSPDNDGSSNYSKMSLPNNALSYAVTVSKVTETYKANFINNLNNTLQQISCQCLNKENGISSLVSAAQVLLTICIAYLFIATAARNTKARNTNPEELTTPVNEEEGENITGNLVVG